MPLQLIFISNQGNGMVKSSKSGNGKAVNQSTQIGFSNELLRGGKYPIGTGGKFHQL